MLRRGIQVLAVPVQDSLSVSVDVCDWIGTSCESVHPIAHFDIPTPTSVPEGEFHAYANRVARMVARRLEDHFHDVLGGASGSESEPVQLKIVK
jgi:hypothetical protein